MGYFESITELIKNLSSKNLEELKTEASKLENRIKKEFPNNYKDIIQDAANLAAKEQSDATVIENMEYIAYIAYLTMHLSESSYMDSLKKTMSDPNDKSADEFHNKNSSSLKSYHIN